MESDKIIRSLYSLKLSRDKNKFTYREQKIQMCPTVRGTEVTY